MKKKLLLGAALLTLIGPALLGGCASSSESSSDVSSDNTTESSSSDSDNSAEVSEILTADETQIQKMSEVFEDETEAGDFLTSPKTAVGMTELPDDYLNDEHKNHATEQGTLEEVQYDRVLTLSDGSTLTSTAVVYLPYGYDESKQYDVLYLMHGMGGTQYTFLGNKVMEGGIKVILDNMIEDGIIRPIIVVAPGLEDSGDVDLDNEVIMELNDSIIQNLMPIVEEKYSTYAESGSEEDLIASRDHRCYGGFSMGGCSSWQMLWHYTEYFKYYIPNSMIADFRLDADVEGTTEEMAEEIRSKGYTSKDFFIYCGVGSHDYTNIMVTKQIGALNDYPDLFVNTEYEGFDNGNLMYRIWSGRYHRFYESFPYFYNALELFFPAE